jgi:hypothetical protein
MIQKSLFGTGPLVYDPCQMVGRRRYQPARWQGALGLNPCYLRLQQRAQSVFSTPPFDHRLEDDDLDQTAPGPVGK